METVYQLKPHELTEDFLKSIIERFGDKEIKITIEEEPFDETEFILRHEVNRTRILAEVEAVKQGKFSHSLTLEEIEAMAK